MKLIAKTIAAAAVIASTAFVSGAIAQDGNAEAGKKVYNKCKTCHVLTGDENKLGPTLECIIGRHSAKIEGFAYSDDLKNLNITWDIEHLTKYITKPKDVAPKGKMAFAGINKPEQIADLLTFIEAETKTDRCPL